MTVYPSPFSTLSFMELLYFAPTERLISPAHATNLHRPDDDLVSSSCNLSYIYDFRSFYQISRTYVTIGKILDGPPAYKNDLSIHPCSSWVAINGATTIVQVFSLSTRKSELQCWSNNGIEGRACIYCTSSTHAIKRDFVHVFKI